MTNRHCLFRSGAHPKPSLTQQQRLTQLRRLRRRALRANHCGTRRGAGPVNSLRSNNGPESLRLGSVPRATTQRRRRCASRCCRDIASHEVFFSKHQGTFLAQVFGVAALPLSRRRGAERQRVFKGLLFERSEFTGPPLARVPQSSPEGTDDVGSAATPNACALRKRDALHFVCRDGIDQRADTIARGCYCLEHRSLVIGSAPRGHRQQIARGAVCAR